MKTDISKMFRDDTPAEVKKQIAKIVEWGSEGVEPELLKSHCLVLVSACEVLYMQGVVVGTKMANKTFLGKR